MPFGDSTRCLCPNHTDHVRCAIGCACSGGRVARRSDGGSLELSSAPKKTARDHAFTFPVRVIREG